MNRFLLKCREFSVFHLELNCGQPLAASYKKIHVLSSWTISLVSGAQSTRTAAEGPAQKMFFIRTNIHINPIRCFHLKIGAILPFCIIAT